MSQPHPRPGMYAWDESDSRSIASHTSSYSSNLFATQPEPKPPAPATTRARGAICQPARLATAMIARIRAKPRAKRAEALHG